MTGIDSERLDDEAEPLVQMSSPLVRLVGKELQVILPGLGELDQGLPDTLAIARRVHIEVLDPARLERDVAEKRVAVEGTLDRAMLEDLLIRRHRLLQGARSRIVSRD